MVKVEPTPIYLIKTRLEVVKNARNDLLIDDLDVRVELTDDALDLALVVHGQVAFLLRSLLQGSVHFRDRVGLQALDLFYENILCLLDSINLSESLLYLLG